MIAETVKQAVWPLGDLFLSRDLWSRPMTELSGASCLVSLDPQVELLCRRPCFHFTDHALVFSHANCGCLCFLPALLH